MNESITKILEAVRAANHAELIAWMDANPRFSGDDEHDALYKLVDAARVYNYDSARAFLARTPAVKP